MAKTTHTIDGGRGPAGGDPDRRGDRHDRALLLTAAAALTLVLVVLLSTVLSPGGGDGAAERTRADDGPAKAPAAAGRPGQAAPPEPERCADGSDPAASLRPSADSGEAVRRITERGRLIVGVDQNSYRWSYVNPHTRQLEGFDIDLVKEIARELLGPQARIVYKTIPTASRVTALEKYEVDLVVRTMTITCERSDEVAFSTAYFEAGQQILVPARSRITGYDSSLRKKKVCTASTSTGETQLKKKSHGAKILAVPNQLDCLVLLQLGEADAVVTDNALAAGQAAQDPSVRLVGEPFTVEPYGVAMNLKDEDLVRRVNLVLDDFRGGGASGGWRTAYDTWLGDVLEESSPAPPKPVYRD